MPENVVENDEGGYWMVRKIQDKKTGPSAIK
jgi:hypothetical protein